MYDAPRNGTFLSDFLTFRFFPKNKNGPFRGEVSVWGHFSGYQILALFFNFSGLRTNFGGSKNRGRHRFSERFLVRHRISWDFTKSVDFCTFQLIFALFVRFSGNRSISALFSGFSGNQPISALFRGLQGVVQGPAGSDFGTSWLRFWTLWRPLESRISGSGSGSAQVQLRVRFWDLLAQDLWLRSRIPGSFGPHLPGICWLVLAVGSLRPDTPGRFVTMAARCLI